MVRLWRRAGSEPPREQDDNPSAGRVYLRVPRAADEQEFVSLMRSSRSFHRQWASAPTDSARFLAYLQDCNRPDFEARLVCRRSDDRILGFFNISQITRGSLQSAYLGYAVGEHYAGQGYMSEAIELLLHVAFVELELHRLEANIQPANEASRALAMRAGFKREGFSPRYLKINGRWRDHERWALLADDWRRAHGLPEGEDLR
ncbi:GNAT family N-acetyltransferase [Conexibacter sp. S30A1]|uniref:GNAT family N-acetyltransferase n=1 Tax=Conexibacter sp. S30A1 TaxID=2937800 RepID=UPI00200D4EC1|nr:GNAT family protein [Conexibacter sp. S30A1]